MTHELSHSTAEQLPPMSAGEAWAEAAQDPALEESLLTKGEGVILSPDKPIALPETLDRLPLTYAKDPLAVVYAGYPRVENEDGTVEPQKSWESGTVFVVYGKSLSTEKIHPDDPDEAIKRTGMMDVPRVFQVDTVRGTTAQVGSVRKSGLVVGRESLPDTATPNPDMSRVHFSLVRTPEGDLRLTDHSKNGTAVLQAEQLSQTKEYTVAHDLGRTVATQEVRQ